MKNNEQTRKLKVSKKLKREFKQFLEYHPPKRVNRNLREVFIPFTQHMLDVIPLNMDDIIWDISSLMELLDVAEDETEGWPGYKLNCTCKYVFSTVKFPMPYFVTILSIDML